MDQRQLYVFILGVKDRIVIARRPDGRLESGVFLGNLVELIVQDISLVHHHSVVIDNRDLRGRIVNIDACGFRTRGVLLL